MSQLEEKEHDWLEGDADLQREDMRAKAVEFAKLYEVFVNTARGKELLEHWERTILEKSTPVESSLQRYVSDESVRDFIRGIRRQIQLAQDPF